MFLPRTVWRIQACQTQQVNILILQLRKKLDDEEDHVGLPVGPAAYSHVWHSKKRNRKAVKQCGQCF